MLLRWITYSGADAVGRLVIQTVSTLLFARLLSPAAFGEAALVAVYVATLSTLVTAVFEESLVQRRRVRTAHFAGALTVVTLGAGSICLVILLSSAIVSPEHGRVDRVLTLASVYSAVLLADGPLSVYTSLSRRRKRFEDIAVSNLLGLAVGSTLGVLLAWNGAGPWSLLSVQLTARFVSLAVIVVRSPIRIVPGRQIRAVGTLFRFGRWTLATRYVGGLVDILLQTLVTRHFGFEGNGLLNMANRIVEPLKAITGPIGHNIAMSYFSRLQKSPERLSHSVELTTAETSLLLQPMFFGAAATAPALVLILGGPQWSAAAPIAVGLALAAAVGSAASFVNNGLLAKGRADLGFLLSAVDLIATVLAFCVLAPLGVVAAGLARLAAWLVEGALVLVMATRIYDVDAPRILRSLGWIAGCAALMAGTVRICLTPLMDALGAIGGFTTAVLLGVALYGAMLHLLRRDMLRAALGRMRPDTKAREGRPLEK